MSGIGYSKEIYGSLALSSFDDVLSAAKEKGRHFVSINTIAMAYLFDSPFTNIEDCAKERDEAPIWGSSELESFYQALNKVLAPSEEVRNEAWEPADIISGDIAATTLANAISAYQKAETSFVEVFNRVYESFASL